MKSMILPLGASAVMALAAWVPAVHANEAERASPSTHSQGIHAAKNDTAQLNGQEQRLSGQESNAGTGRARNTVGCGDVISEPGNYRLASDQVCVETLEINSSNVNLNMAGHTLQCDADGWVGFPANADENDDLTPWRTGIQINTPNFEFVETSVSGITIRNGTITGCAIGIFMPNVTDSKVTKMNITENNFGEFNEGIYGHAILLVGSDDNKFIGNSLTNNGNGLVSFGSDGNRYTNNQFDGNTHDGFFLGTNSSANTIRRNTMSDNQEVGIWVEDSSNNRFQRNEVARNGGSGVLLVSSGTGNVFLKNRVARNGDIGIAIAGLSIPEFDFSSRPEDNLVIGNKVLENATADMAEAVAVLDTDFQIIDRLVAEECANTWVKNTFDTTFAPANCID